MVSALKPDLVGPAGEDLAFVAVGVLCARVAGGRVEKREPEVYVRLAVSALQEEGIESPHLERNRGWINYTHPKEAHWQAMVETCARGCG